MCVLSPSGQDQAGNTEAASGDHPDGHKDWGTATHTATGQAEGEE